MRIENKDARLCRSDSRGKNTSLRTCLALTSQPERLCHRSIQSLNQCWNWMDIVCRESASDWTASWMLDAGRRTASGANCSKQCSEMQERTGKKLRKTSRSAGLIAVFIRSFVIWLKSFEDKRLVSGEFAGHRRTQCDFVVLRGIEWREGR